MKLIKKSKNYLYNSIGICYLPFLLPISSLFRIKRTNNVIFDWLICFFAGLQPNVFDVIDEYLKMIETYPTSMSIIRTHLFNLLSRVFEVIFWHLALVAI